MKKVVSKDIFRVIDANLNRSREGLRVCEEVSRFVLNSPALTAELKLVRHGISETVKALPSRGKALLESRDSENDVGRCSKLHSEMRRSGPADLFIANIQRVKESLRVLEEFTKLIDVKGAAKYSRLRFKVYDIEKKAVKKALK